MNDFERIITHHDFDGLVSAAICSRVTGCGRFVFTGPNSIARAEISIDERDIVCDLPYPLQCGLWFDHHAGNAEALRLRGIDPGSLPGRFSEEPSCARVVFEYFTEKGTDFPEFYRDTVREADTIDSFDYESIEEWRTETPGKLVDMSIKAPFETPRERTKYHDYMVEMIRDRPLADITREERVILNIERYRREEEKMVEVLERTAGFLQEDTSGEIVVVDLTGFSRPPRIIRNLAFLVHPESLAALIIKPIFRGGTKTNDFSLSMSLSVNMTNREHGKDIGEIMRVLNIGDGHPGAAAGIVRCGSKKERQKRKDDIVDEIRKLWKEMPLEL